MRVISDCLISFQMVDKFNFGSANRGCLGFGAGANFRISLGFCEGFANSVKNLFGRLRIVDLGKCFIMVDV